MRKAWLLLNMTPVVDRSNSVSGSVLALILTLLLGLISEGEGIDCYKCTSINGKTEECEDNFDTGDSTVHLIARNCVYGYFRGTHCIKLKGEKEDGTRIMVRDCSNDDWGSHCGDIRYLHGDGEQRIYGCLEGCDQDGCNQALARTPPYLLVTLLSLAATALLAHGVLARHLSDLIRV